MGKECDDVDTFPTDNVWGRLGLIDVLAFWVWLTC